MIGRLFLIMISIFLFVNFVNAINITEFNYSYNYSQLPVSNEVLINITGEQEEFIEIEYLNVTDNTLNYTINQSWVDGPDNITFSSNKSSGTYVFNFTIPLLDTDEIHNFSQVITFIKNQTENITFFWQIIDDRTQESQYNYTGDCILINIYSNTTLNFELNTTQLPFDNTTCWAFWAEQNTNISFFSDDWLSLNVQNLFYENTTTKEFNINLHIPAIGLTIPSKEYSKSVIMFSEGISRIINYQIELINPDYVVVEGNVTNETIENYTWLPSLENMTATELLLLIQNYSQLVNESRPKYIVTIKNQTKYVSVPLSAELMAKWIEEYDPNKITQLEQELNDWKKKYGEEESDNEFVKEQLTTEKQKTLSLEKKLNSTTTMLQYKIKSMQKKYQKILFQIFGGIFIVTIILSLIIFFIRRKQYYPQDI